MAKTSIQYIKEAAKVLINSKLQGLDATKMQEVLQGVMQTVGLESMEEVYLFVAQFDLTCGDRTSNMNDLSRYFECPLLDMIEFVPALKSLERKGLLVRRNRMETNIINQDFAVNDSVMAAVIENQTVEIKQLNVDELRIDKYEFCKRIAEQVEDRNVGAEDLVRFVKQMEKSNYDIFFVQELSNLVNDIYDRILFYDMCYDNCKNDGDGDSDISRTLRDVINNNTVQYILTKKKIIEEEHILFKLGLIEKSDNENVGICLSDKGKELYYGEDLVAFQKSYKCCDIYAFLDKVDDYFHDNKNNKYDRDGYSPDSMRWAIEKIEKANTHIPVLESIKKSIRNDYERVMFYITGSDLVGDLATSLTSEIQALYPRTMRQRVVNDFKNHANNLQLMGLVGIENKSSLFGDRTCIVLTDKGKEMLLEEDASLYCVDSSNKLLLPSKKIAEKKLFFSGELNEQLSLLRNSLTEDYYQSLCSRLKDKQLSKGIAVLLYGEPGTGKTESVMQIARATGRDIMHVDISATKTCWFGESEKLIKKVFTDYRHLCEKSMITPILLFNEADAIFSKRKDVNSGSVAQTENAIQNIILEEIENLDGILIATTNLVENLDGAFERRFLFKIWFDKPSIEAKTSIWMNKLPSISVDDAQILASGYNFSGGQIDNIARKILMQEVINDETPTLDSIMKMCNEETISKVNIRRIGFC